MSSNNEMKQSSSFGHVVGQATNNTNNSHRVAAGFDQNSGTNSTTGIGTPRSALYYPEKEVHYGQMDHDRNFQNEQQDSMNGTVTSSHVSHPLGFNNNEASAYRNSPNASIPPSIVPA
jgi:hypothetical protein